MEGESDKARIKNHLSYNVVLSIGIGLLVCGSIVGGVIGMAIRVGSDLLSWISIILIVLQTFQKNTARKIKLIGWGLILLWIATSVAIGISIKTSA